MQIDFQFFVVNEVSFNYLLSFAALRTLFLTSWDEQQRLQILPVRQNRRAMALNWASSFLFFFRVITGIMLSAFIFEVNAQSMFAFLKYQFLNRQ